MPRKNRRQERHLLMTGSPFSVGTVAMFFHGLLAEAISERERETMHFCDKSAYTKATI